MKMDLGWATVSLFAGAPYSAGAASPSCIVGLAFERQRGVHAIGSDRRQDFDAWPGDLAITQPGVPIFSESASGGEYLALHVAQPPAMLDAPRTVLRGARHAMLAGARLRAALLAVRPDAAHIEEQAALFLACSAGRHTGAPRAYHRDRASHARVLDYIEEHIDAQLRLALLASLAGMPLLRFVRSFAAATGMTPHGYVNERRLQRARYLLQTTGEPVAGIACDCGFAHQSHLGALLRKQIGVTPVQYRARYRAN